jgi:Domain of unknown function (DUF4252)
MRNPVTCYVKRIVPLIVFVAMGILMPILAAAPAAFAQSAKLDLSSLDKLAVKASNVTNVNLDRDALQLASGHVSEKQHNLLQRLKGVYVRDFEFSKPGEYSRSDVDAILKQLRSAGWKGIVNVEDKKSGEITDVYLMSEGGQTVGMAVVDAEPKELTVVNLVGPIDLSEMGNLGGSFGIPAVALHHRGPASTGEKPAGKRAGKNE